jgi:hypothetical protein
MKDDKRVNTRSKWLIVILIAVVLCSVSLLAFGFYSSAQNSNRSIYSSGHGVTYPTSIDVDEMLKPYINITIGGSQGAGGEGSSWTQLNGTVSWIGSSQDSVKSLRNIHLSIYTRLDENLSMSKNTYLLYVGIHLQANQTEPTIPADAIDHQEVTIPTIGIDKPQYPFSFTCSTAVN